jgi:NADH:ubiquinone oxidoreductase subunit 4 (subunit M)
MGLFFLVTFVSKSVFLFAPLVYTIAAVGIIYTFTAIRQTDFKELNSTSIAT